MCRNVSVVALTLYKHVVDYIPRIAQHRVLHRPSWNMLDVSSQRFHQSLWSFAFILNPCNSSKWRLSSYQKEEEVHCVSRIQPNITVQSRSVLLYQQLHKHKRLPSFPILSNLICLCMLLGVSRLQFRCIMYQRSQKTDLRPAYGIRGGQGHTHRKRESFHITVLGSQLD